MKTELEKIFLIFGAKIWAGIPFEIKLKPINMFKSKLKNTMLKSIFWNKSVSGL